MSYTLLRNHMLFIWPDFGRFQLMEVDRNSLFNCCPNPHIFLMGSGLNKMPLSLLQKKCGENRNKKKNSNLQPIYYNVSVDLCDSALISYIWTFCTHKCRCGWWWHRFQLVENFNELIFNEKRNRNIVNHSHKNRWNFNHTSIQKWKRLIIINRPPTCPKCTKNVRICTKFLMKMSQIVRNCRKFLIKMAETVRNFW